MYVGSGTHASPIASISNSASRQWFQFGLVKKPAAECFFCGTCIESTSHRKASVLKLLEDAHGNRTMALVDLDGICSLFRRQRHPVPESVRVHVSVRASEEPANLINGNGVHSLRNGALQALKGVVAVSSRADLGDGPVPLDGVEFAMKFWEEIDGVTMGGDNLSKISLLTSEVRLSQQPRRGLRGRQSSDQRERSFWRQRRPFLTSLEEDVRGSAEIGVGLESAVIGAGDG